MASGEHTLDGFKPLIDNMLNAVLEDFRYAEAIARQAGALISRKEAKSPRRKVGVGVGSDV